MITYDTPLRFDLVTSTCDAMNHILDPFDLAEVMHRVHGYLAPGGYFLFDLLKEGETAECDPEDLGEIDGTRLQFQIGRTEEGLVNLKIELFRDEVVVQTEEIRERIYSPEFGRAAFEAGRISAGVVYGSAVKRIRARSDLVCDRAEKPN